MDTVLPDQKTQTPELEMNADFKAGTIAIVGRPNVGKSTLLNHILGEKVAIATSRVQTTRYRLRGIHTIEDKAQIVFVDTPGFSKPLDELGERLTAESQAALADADAVLFVVDGTSDVGSGDQWLAEQIKLTQKPVVMVFNKIDRIASNQTQTQRAQGYFNLFEGHPNFSGLVVSAKTGRHTPKIIDKLVTLLPTQPPLYDPDMYTDQHVRDMAIEYIREKVMMFTDDELPHSVAVVLELFDESDPELIKITAVLYTEKESQKGIIIGKGGQMIRRIGQSARQDIEQLVDAKVYLELHVKVKLNWRKDAQFLKGIGYTG